MPVDSPWRCAYELDANRKPVAGSESDLCHAIRRGADLRVYTEFYYEEHVAPFQNLAGDTSADGLVREVIDFRETILIDNRHVAGITTTRQPMNPILGFNGASAKMSYFMYNMTGHQSCASLSLDAIPEATDTPGVILTEPAPTGVPKMSETEAHDVGSACPSRNFIYQMETYRFWVQDNWTEELAHDEQGEPIRGSWEALSESHKAGREIKVAIGGLYNDIGTGMPEEVFTPVGTAFNHMTQQLFETQSHPIVRVSPSIPMKYASGRWDVSWLIIRTNGLIEIRTLTPHTRKFHDWSKRCPCRWFVR